MRIFCDNELLTSYLYLKGRMRSRRKSYADFLGAVEYGPVHPLVVGVFRWLKANVERWIADPSYAWDGAMSDLGSLRAGLRTGSCPGRIITPEDPEGFDFHVLERANDGSYREGLENLNRYVWSVDSGALVEMVEVLKVTPTKQLYAELTLKGLERALDSFVIEGPETREPQLTTERKVA